MQPVKWLKLFIYSVNLPWVTLPPVFVHRQDRIATKIAYVEPNILPEPIKFYTNMPVVPVTNSMSALKMTKTSECRSLLSKVAEPRSKSREARIAARRGEGGGITYHTLHYSEG